MTDDTTASLTHIESDVWSDAPPGLRAWERSVAVGAGDTFWQWAGEELLRWGVKTRSGFRVDPRKTVATGDRPTIVARVAGLAIREPVEVVAVVRRPDRVGFAYRTLSGHPVSGEEAFILSRRGDAVMLTIRSLTGVGDRIGWRLAYPLLLVAQRVARRRYARALRVSRA